jgi:hypothetical protein
MGMSPRKDTHLETIARHLADEMQVKISLED